MKKWFGLIGSLGMITFCVGCEESMQMDLDVSYAYNIQ